MIRTGTLVLLGCVLLNLTNSFMSPNVADFEAERVSYSDSFYYGDDYGDDGDGDIDGGTGEIIKHMSSELRTVTEAVENATASYISACKIKNVRRRSVGEGYNETEYIVITNVTRNLESSGNSTANYTISCKNPMDMGGISYFFIVMYCLIFIVASSGNFLVVYVVMTNKRMQTVTNIFITNLAVSDIMVNFTSLWLTPTYTYIGHWIFGGGLCHGLPLFQGTSIFISTWTLTAIAIDRYIVIVRNSSNVNINDRMSMRTCLLFIVLIWLSSLLLVTPYAINMKLNYISDPCDFLICSEDWSDDQFRSVFGIIVMILQFIFPFVLIGISYWKIWWFLSSRQCMTERKSEMARKKKVLLMLIVMVVIFAVCWFPFNLLNCLRDLKLDGFMKGYFSFVFLSVHLMSMTATAWNPILYAFMNENFREEFAKVVPILFARHPEGRIRVITERSARYERPVQSEEPQRSIVYLNDREHDSGQSPLL